MNTTVEILGFGRGPGWLPWTVQYFFLMGISIAAFFLSLPGLAWRSPSWRGVSRRALLAALVCGIAAPAALLADLHQPGRFLNFYLHSNPTSWMAWGAYFIPLYLFGLLLYAWLCLRPQLAAMAQRGARPSGLYRALAYGGHENPGAIRAAGLMAAIGAACVLLYSGMEVMVVAARPLWHTPLLPLLLAATALAGGIGMTAVFEAVCGSAAAAPLLNRWLTRSLWAALAVLAAWLALALSGAARPAAEALAMTGGSLGWKLAFGWLVASLALPIWAARARPRSLLLPALLALHAAWLVRWIVLIGGQGLPKMGATFAAYSLTPTPDGLLGILGSAGLCLVLYIGLTGFVSWDEPAQA